MKDDKIRKRYNQVQHLTQDTTWESNKYTINITNKSQEVSPFPAGDHKPAMNRRESMRNTRRKTQMIHPLKSSNFRSPLLLKISNSLKKVIKCSASLAFNRFSPTSLINSILHEHLCKILFAHQRHLCETRV